MKLELPDYNYCPMCGEPVNISHREGRERPVCKSCGHIVYINPIPAACQVVLNERKVLLTLRAFDPQKGMWCLPGGFIEWGECPEDGAKRELYEETGITAQELSLIGVYDSITGTKRHVLLIAYLILNWDGEPAAGDDADEVRWFGIKEIPQLAFKVHQQVLDDLLKKENIV
ncbi:MAG TPA: NUDIX domain-containing protein [bacterium]|nr:NUDIX domain-containing protein [bacterium]